jgi:hypothetical protein
MAKKEKQEGRTNKIEKKNTKRKVNGSTLLLKKVKEGRTRRMLIVARKVASAWSSLGKA